MRKVASEPNGSAALAVEQWAKAGRQLRLGLVREVEDLEARLQHARSALERISALEKVVAHGAEGDEEETEGVVVVNGKPPTVASAILAVVGKHPGGVTLAEIRDALVASGLKFEPKNLPTYMYRLNQAKSLVARGRRGGRKYKLPTGN